MTTAIELTGKEIILVSQTEYDDTTCPDINSTINIVSVLGVNVETGETIKYNANTFDPVYRNIIKNAPVNKKQKITLWKVSHQLSGNWCYDHNCTLNKCKTEDHSINPF